MSWVQALAPQAGDAALEARVRRVLAEGGDERIALSPVTGRNRYGCGVVCEPHALEFSASTASTPSPGAVAAAAEALARLEAAPLRETYAREAQAIRRELAALNGLPAAAAEDIILAASGTDLHLIAADLARGAARKALTAVIPDPRESGSGVPNALRALRYAQAAPHGGGGRIGEPLPGASPGRLVSIALRQPDGAPRDPAALDAEAEAACEAAAARGEPVLLVLLDVSKTGLTAPSPGCAARLKARFGEALTVLVDACQFRISEGALARYLACGFLVAVTGSKFLGGPAFSGALFAPESEAARLRTQPLLPALGEVSGRSDWPAAYTGRSVLPDAPNPGLALRWRAALHELAAFRQAPAAELRSLLAELGWAVKAKLASDPRLEVLPTPAPQRFGAGGWDELPTIFPFLLRRAGERLDASATQAVYERLRSDPERPLRLGQPVLVGERDGAQVSALRLALRAGQLVEALESPAARRRLVEGALGALAAAADAV